MFAIGIPLATANSEHAQTRLCSLYYSTKSQGAYKPNAIVDQKDNKHISYSWTTLLSLCELCKENQSRIKCIYQETKVEYRINFLLWRQNISSNKDF